MASSPSRSSSSTESNPILPVENPMPISYAPPSLSSSDTDDEDIDSFLKNVLVDEEVMVEEDKTNEKKMEVATEDTVPKDVALKLATTSTGEASSSKRPRDLPDGWEIQVKEREHGKSAGHKDKYYIQPVTGRRFRSMREVIRFLATGIARMPKAETSGSRMLAPRHENQDHVVGEPSDERYLGDVTWVLGPSSDDTDTTPFVEGAQVSSEIHEAWEHELHRRITTGDDEERPSRRQKPDDGKPNDGKPDDGAG